MADGWQPCLHRFPNDLGQEPRNHWHWRKKGPRYLLALHTDAMGENHRGDVLSSTSCYRWETDRTWSELRSTNWYPFKSHLNPSGLGFPLSYFLSGSYSIGQLRTILLGLGSPFSCPLTSLMLIPNDTFSGCFHKRNPIGQGCVGHGPEKRQGSLLLNLSD